MHVLIRVHLNHNNDLASLVVTYLVQHREAAHIEFQTALNWEGRSCTDQSLWNAVLIRSPRLVQYCPLEVNPLPILAECGHVKQLSELSSKTWYNVRLYQNLVLRLAADAGHHKVLEVLRIEYGLTGQDARARQNEALRMAAKNGHIEVLRELRLGYGLTMDDAIELNSYAFNAACEYPFVLAELQQFPIQ